MAANDLPLEFVLRRSLTQGFVKTDDPELLQLRRSQSSSNAMKDRSRIEPGYSGSLVVRVPMSSSLERSIQHSVVPSNSTRQSLAQSRMNTINSRRARKTGVALSGYGLDDFSSSSDDGETDDSSESEDDDIDARKSDAANYITHLTSRLDPWEWKIRKVQEETKEIAPKIAQKIERDLKTFEMRPATAPNWIRNVDDVAQQIKAMELETQSIKEKRRKEFETRQLAVDKEVEDCLRKVRDERETAIRIREEAVRQAQLEKEKAAKAEEEKAKAIVAQKQAQDKKAAEQAAAAEKAQKAEKDKKVAAAAAAEKAKSAAAAGIADASSNTGSNFVSETALVEYKRYMDLLAHLKTVAVPAVENDPAIRKFCAGIRREIMPSIGQLINKQHEIIRVAMEIDQQFKKAMQTQNENVYYWVLNFTAKKLTKQAEGEALVKAAPAFPLAHVAVLLFTNHPRFMDVLLARFVKKCPYTAPLYMSKESSESPDEFLHRLGYKKKEKRLENEAEYNGRQCAIFTLYCAIMQTNPPAGRNLYPLSNGWTWMSRVLNMPPRPITPSLITVFLEVCGERYLRTYGNQARKVIQLLVNEFIPLIPRQGKDGTTRLKTLLEEYLRTGQFSVVEGREFDR